MSPGDVRALARLVTHHEAAIAAAGTPAELEHRGAAIALDLPLLGLALVAALGEQVGARAQVLGIAVEYVLIPVEEPSQGHELGWPPRGLGAAMPSM